jgi:copper(I)-binding protein
MQFRLGSGQGFAVGASAPRKRLKSPLRTGLLVIFAVTAMVVACGAPAGPSIEVEEVWARPAMAMMEGAGSSEGEVGMGQPMAGTGAVFMVIRNSGSEADRLVGGQTEVAGVVEIHETVMEGEVMKMQMLANGLEVPAKGEVLLKPGGYHVMLIGMQRDLAVGDTFTLELQFEKSGSLRVEPEVREP